MNEPYIHLFSNGFRLVYKHIADAEVSHLGVTIESGSRDEASQEHGLAHYIEHCIFKGTPKRKAYHILSRLDAVGGELNAYTTKEDTCIYASFQSKFFERTMELIADITLNSVFPPKEIEKEKAVIIDEIKSYKDSPDEMLFEEFEEHLFKGHPIGNAILGTAKTVKKFSREDILGFVHRNYHPSRMILSAVGSVPLNKVIKWTEKYFSHFPATNYTGSRLKPIPAAPFHLRTKKKIYQANCLIGAPAYSAKDDKRTGLVLLNNILGGPGMNNRLNLNIRERYGVTYNIESNYNLYSDTGLFSIYFGCDSGSIEKVTGLVLSELKKLREIPLGKNQLHQAKQQLKGYIALSQESRLSMMLALGKTVMLFNEIDTIQDIYKKIDALTAQDLLQIANETFPEEKLSSLYYIPA
jgi:predicted Zn-dependent peptidase